MPITIQIGMQYARASIKPTSLNVATRTVDVVFATETPVPRRNWDIGDYLEVLVCDTNSVDLTRINAGAPVLDAHNGYQMSSQLGVVENARVENGQCVATLRFSKRLNVEPIWQDVQDGIYQNISVGYDVAEFTIPEYVEGTVPTYRATKWTPGEISLVPIPADINSGVRSEAQTHNVSIINNSKIRNMDPIITEPVIPAVIPTAIPLAETAEQLRSQGATAERVRTKGIMEACRTTGMTAAFEVELVGGVLSLDQCRAAIITQMANTQPEISGATSGAVRVGADAVDKMRTGLTNSLIARVDPTAANQALAGEYRGMSLVDMCRECLQSSGVNTRGMSHREVASAALGLTRSGGMLGSSDFPSVLANTFNKRLRKAYELQERTFVPWTVASTATDFRDMLRIQLGDLQFDSIIEGGEYKAGKLSDSQEKYRVTKYGKKVLITWETIINDDLNAFNRMPTIMASAATQKQSDIVYGILTANAVMNDNVALFHATHGNLAASGTDITIASLSAGRLAMRNQKSLGGNLINVVPKILVCGPAKEAVALQMTSQNYVATKQTDMNVWAGSLTPIIDPRITDNSWYLTGSPSSMDTIEYAFLDGQEMFTEERLSFDQDGYEIKARMVFGAKAIDFRGMYKNPGA